MKKLILLAAFVIGGTFYSSTQAQTISDNALGVRFGGGNGLGAELSYQKAQGDNNRLEFGLAWRTGSDFNAFKLSGLYQWVWNIEGGFNWYAGVGAGVGSVDYDNDRFDNRDDEVFILAAGNIGIEYNFNIPLLVSLDFRPEFGFGDDDVYDAFSPDIALGVRYQF